MKFCARKDAGVDAGSLFKFVKGQGHSVVGLVSGEAINSLDVGGSG
ncbi:hypothetical protein [Gulosibacter chungangensis]|nr:hypothetical protein [Gulosibacter chungangensis]